MSTTTAPIVLADETLYCDGNPEHEVRIVTDGHKAYAYGTDRGGVDDLGICRDGVLITIDCGQPGYADEPCSGRLVLDLTAAAVWEPAEGERLRLFGFAKPVDVADEEPTDA